MELSRALLAELRELADKFDAHPDALQAYVQQDGTCPDDIPLWHPCARCRRTGLTTGLRSKLDALRLYLGVPVAEVFPKPTTFNMADIAELREITTANIRRLRNRYPAGHPNAFPQPEDPDAYSPWWNADRADELKAWKPTGRGKGGGRPKPPTGDTATDAHTPADSTADPAGTNQATHDPFAPLEPLRPINKAATNHVFRNLQRQRDGDLWNGVGETFSFESRETYRRDAMAWLGDHTELSHRTIEAADWNEVHDYFRPAPKQTPEPEPVAEPFPDRPLSDNPEHAGMTSLWQILAYEKRKTQTKHEEERKETKRRKALAAPTVTDPATASRVYVDVVEPGKAVIVGPGFQGRAGVDDAAKTRRYWVELTGSDIHPDDVEKTIGHARTYRAVGEILANHHGLTNYYVDIDHER